MNETGNGVVTGDITGFQRNRYGKIHLHSHSHRHSHQSLNPAIRENLYYGVRGRRQAKFFNHGGIMQLELIAGTVKRAMADAGAVSA